MLSVVIPSLNAERHLPRTLAALVGPTVRGRICEVILADGGSQDDTAAIAEASGARLIVSAPGRGAQLRQGVAAARSEWLLVLHADTVLATGWDDEVATFVEKVEQGMFGGGGAKAHEVAAVFSFRLDHFSRRARFLECMVALRCLLFALPYGDQGLLISRRFYEKLGGYRALPLMEDVDIIRRIGRRRLVRLRAYAVTSAERYERDGFFLRAGRNLCLLTLYFLRVPPSLLARLYA